MCKNKSNILNFDYKKITNDHNGLESISIFGISYCMKKRRFHLPHQFNKEYYESIEDFQGEKVINAPMHFTDMNVENDAFYKQTYTKNSKWK